MCDRSKVRLTRESGWWHLMNGEYDLCSVEYEKLSDEEQAKYVEIKDFDGVEDAENGDEHDFGIVCDRTKGNLTTDSGWWHKVGEQYDLCTLELEKLPADERAKYVQIKQLEDLGADLDKYMGDDDDDDDDDDDGDDDGGGSGSGEQDDDTAPKEIGTCRAPLPTAPLKTPPSGDPKLTKCDESTICPGLFLCGPQVRQSDQIFCFVYKYRQRFAVVVNQVALRLGLQTAPVVARCKKQHMFLDCIEDCKATCGASGSC